MTEVTGFLRPLLWKRTGHSTVRFYLERECDMEFDEIKQYVNTYLVEHGCRLDKMYTDDHYLNTATKRYQFFGDKMFSIHAQF